MQHKTDNTARIFERSINADSLLMSIAKKAGFQSLAWSLRRLHCPVGKNDLVLEVGSGGNPYYRANVLIDAYLETRERHWEPLIADRPIVLGVVEKLPFRDKAFDFVIASHVLEHSKDPETFLRELSRVAKAGYIEVPDAFMERINPYLDHRLEITVREDMLLIKKKSSQQVDPELVELYSNRANRVVAGDTMSRFPFHFHVRYYWQDNISFKVLNPEVDAGWLAPEASEQKCEFSIRARMNKTILWIVRKLFSQNRRNRRINLLELMCCPLCRSTHIQRHVDIECKSCGVHFPINSDIPDMTAPVEA